MRVSVLASGSSGNASFVELAGTKLLIDAGISMRRIKTGLAGIGVGLDQLDGILVTHEHRDHINGLAMLMRHSTAPLYVREQTYDNLSCRSLIDPKRCRFIGGQFGVGGVRVEAFNISHDAVDPVGFSLYGQSVKCTVATDLGFVTSSVQQALDYSDVLILEANHDVDMLNQGAYPAYLKHRILSNRGHLSNNDAAYALVRMKKKERLKVLLAHLSADNNRPQVAAATVGSIMAAHGYDLAGGITIGLAKQSEAVNLLEEG